MTVYTDQVEELDALRQNSEKRLEERLRAQEELKKVYKCAGFGYDQAHKLGRKIAQSAFSLRMRESDDEYVPLPEDLSLVQLVQLASGPHLARLEDDGTMSFCMTVAERGVAACFAFENFGRSPHGILEACGYNFTEA